MSSPGNSPAADARRRSAADLTELVRCFEDGSLPREQWTHEAHVLVGLWYVLDDPERAFERMGAGIERYNRSAGRNERERNGYDAEVTRRWIERIRTLAEGVSMSALDGTRIQGILDRCT